MEVYERFENRGRKINAMEKKGSEAMEKSNYAQENSLGIYHEISSKSRYLTANVWLVHQNVYIFNPGTPLLAIAFQESLCLQIFG